MRDVRQLNDDAVVKQPDGTRRELFATGLRNSMGFAIYVADDYAGVIYRVTPSP